MNWTDEEVTDFFWVPLHVDIALSSRPSYKLFNNEGAWGRQSTSVMSGCEMFPDVETNKNSTKLIC